VTTGSDRADTAAADEALERQRIAHEQHDAHESYQEWISQQGNEFPHLLELDPPEGFNA
jgi:hypothetical protein